MSIILLSLVILYGLHVELTCIKWWKVTNSSPKFQKRSMNHEEMTQDIDIDYTVYMEISQEEEHIVNTNMQITTLNDK